ncbi:hypothetical protein B0H63DRAFT_454681 [Podospora didyma]|uniref:AA1-like domain-containing protein n=1 Tax=Podospora didyma TaxID=330526 RepID=A0AAE0K6S6_9PEZI|nr:hypothetical protein B0H63DRAFT_454681 [Podospora didyma]
MYTTVLALLALPLTHLTSASPVQIPGKASVTRDTDSDTDSDTGCTHTSFNGFQWDVQAFDYHASFIFTTPAHQNSWGYVNFNLSNPADKSLAKCSASSNQLSDFFYGNMVYNCETAEGKQTGSFDFNKASGELRVNQTWRCDDQDPQWPIRIKASGSAIIPLDCTERLYQNANWTLGQIYSTRDITCKPVTLPIVPTEISAVA